MPPARGDRLLEAAEVAELLAVSPRFVREHTRSGAIPAVRLPGTRVVRYRRESVLAWVETLESGGHVVKPRKHRPSSRGAE